MCVNMKLCPESSGVITPTLVDKYYHHTPYRAIAGNVFFSVRWVGGWVGGFRVGM